MSKQYVYIEPFVYTVYKNNQVLLYNTYSGNYIIEKVSEEIFSDFLNKLLNSKIRIIEYLNKYNVPVITQFIEKCKEMFIADFHFGEKPFIQPFDFRIIYDLNYLKTTDNYRRISSLVKQINIVLSKSTNCKNEKLNKNGIKQFLFPSDFGTDCSIDADSLASCLSNVKFNIENISIIGDFFQYKNLQKVLDLFNKNQITYFAYYLDFKSNFFFTNNFINATFVFWIDFPYNKSKIEEINSVLQPIKVNYFFNYIVTSEKEYFEFEILNSKERIQPFKIIPFFNDENYDFFKKNIFINKEDIFSQMELNDTKIISNMNINSNFFGELYFVPDNKIYTNLNSKELGSIGDNWKLLLQERLLNDPIWFNIRNQKPCSKCLYQFLCPSPSNYELVLGKPNLCHIIHEDE